MMDDFGSSKVSIKKTELLEAVRKNRETHIADYKEAREGFEKGFLKEAEKLVVRIKEGNFDRNVINLSAPINHDKDYNLVIRMLEMSTANEISITQNQFSQFVLDEWNWKEQFSNSTMNYKSMR